jgi:hypothetical protein
VTTQKGFSPIVDYSIEKRRDLRISNMSSGRRLLVGWLGVLLQVANAFSVEGRKPILHGDAPPKAIREVAYAEALKFRRAMADEPDIGWHDKPILLSSQRTVDFAHPSRAAWLMVHSVGRQGPRANTNVSQLTLVSAEDGRVLLKSPQGPKDDEDSCPRDMDDAVMVEIAAGRFVLGLSCGEGGRWTGSASILALGGKRSLASLFHVPDENDGRHIASTVYFVRPPDEKTTALAVQQEEITFVDPSNPKLTKREFLCRLDPKAGSFERVPYPPGTLSKLIETARRRSSAFIFQGGSMAFDANAMEIEEAAKAERELNRVYQQLQKKLEPDGREQLKREQLGWLAQRDSLGLEKRTGLTEKRIEELRRRMR